MQSGGGEGLRGPGRFRQAPQCWGPGLQPMRGFPASSPSVGINLVATRANPPSLMKAAQPRDRAHLPLYP